jgi:orotate phosphoribosyltransferase
MISYNESLKILKETNALLEGHFILSSGLHTNRYIQCAKLLSEPKQSQIICKSLSEKINENYKKVDLILSPAVGGIVIGYEVGRQLNTTTIFSERVDGDLVLRRGFFIKPKSNVLVVEDVITTGKSALECFDIIKSYKANLVGFACLIDRSDEKLLIKEKIVSQVKLKIDTYNKNELPKELESIPATKPGSRNLSK